MKTSRMIHKVISITLVFTFLCQQIAWGDFLTDATLRSDEIEQSQSAIPQWARDMEAKSKALMINQKQLMEDLSNKIDLHNETNQKLLTEVVAQLKRPVSSEAPAQTIQPAAPTTNIEEGAQNTAAEQPVDPSAAQVVDEATKEAALIAKQQADEKVQAADAELVRKQVEEAAAREALITAQAELEAAQAELAQREADAITAQQALELINSQVEAVQADLAAKQADSTLAQQTADLANQELAAAQTDLVKREADLLKAQEILALAKQRASDNTLTIANLHWADFAYSGSFRIKEVTGQASRFGYGGLVMAYNPYGNGGQGSLFVSGHVYQDMISEIGIPTLAQWQNNTTVINNLPASAILQQFGNIAPGYLGSTQVDGAYSATMDMLSGLLVTEAPSSSSPTLLWTVRKEYYNSSGNYASLGTSTLNIADPQATGLLNITGYHYNATAGYLAEIPAEFADRYIGGKNIISGEQGLGSVTFGPTAFAIDPWTDNGTFQQAGTQLPATPLVYYPSSHPYPGWVSTNKVDSVQWVQVGEKQALMFSVTVNSQTELWFYSSEDIAKVASGQMAPWDIRPYEKASLSAYMRVSLTRPGPIAFDTVNKRLFYLDMQGYRPGYEPIPVIHVFQAGQEIDVPSAQQAVDLAQQLLNDAQTVLAVKQATAIVSQQAADLAKQQLDETTALLAQKQTDQTSAIQSLALANQEFYAAETVIYQKQANVLAAQDAVTIAEQGVVAAQEEAELARHEAAHADAEVALIVAKEFVITAENELTQKQADVLAAQTARDIARQNVDAAVENVAQELVVAVESQRVLDVAQSDAEKAQAELATKETESAAAQEAAAMAEEQLVAAQADLAVKEADYAQALEALTSLKQRASDNALSLLNLSWADFAYSGSFRIKEVTGQASRFGYGGLVMAYNPYGTGGQGSLFVSGHPYQGMIAELGIPTLAQWQNSTVAINNLPVAAMLQRFGSIAPGYLGITQVDKANSANMDMLSGLLVTEAPSSSSPTLLWTVRKEYCNNSGNYASLGTSTLNIADPQATGLLKITGYQYNATAGYLAEIPAEFADRYIGGKNIISGEQGLGSVTFGPTAFAIDPWTDNGTFQQAGTQLPATPLVYYPSNHPYPGWVSTNKVDSVQWVQVGNKQALMFSVTVNSKTELWFYSAEDIAKVATGQMAPWDIRPYEKASLSAYMRVNLTRPGPIAFDTVNKRLFYLDMQGYRVGYEPIPVIHVFQAKIAGEISAAQLALDTAKKQVDDATAVLAEKQAMATSAQQALDLTKEQVVVAQAELSRKQAIEEQVRQVKDLAIQQVDAAVAELDLKQAILEQAQKTVEQANLEVAAALSELAQKQADKEAAQATVDILRMQDEEAEAARLAAEETARLAAEEAARLAAEEAARLAAEEAARRAAEESLLSALDLQWSDFAYSGAFRIQEVSGQASRFGYGGALMTYNPYGNGGQGSLLISGHPYQYYIAEVGIPTPGIWHSDLTTINSLPAATTLQSFGNIAPGYLWSTQTANGESGLMDMLSGILVTTSPGTETPTLLWTVRHYYNVASADYNSHGASTLNLSDPRPTGIWNIKGYSNNTTAGYLAEIPAEFAAEYLDGKNIITGMQGAAGQASTSQGPCAFAIQPWNADGALPQNGAQLDATPLIYYPMGHDYPGWKLANKVDSVQWVKDGDKQALVFSVTVGLGQDWYGAGASYPYLAGGDTLNTGKGYHAPPYDTQLWFYSAEDIAKVASGQMQPWDIRPYQQVSIANYLRVDRYSPGPIAYDSVNKRLFYLDPTGARTAYEPVPIVHVFQLNSEATL